MKIYVGTYNYIFVGLAIMATFIIGMGFGVIIDGIIASVKNYNLTMLAA